MSLESAMNRQGERILTPPFELLFTPQVLAHYPLRLARQEIEEVVGEARVSVFRAQYEPLDRSGGLDEKGRLAIPARRLSLDLQVDVFR